LLGEEMTTGGREGGREGGAGSMEGRPTLREGGKEGRREGGEKGGRAYLNSSCSSSHAVRISFLYKYCGVG